MFEFSVRTLLNGSESRIPVQAVWKVETVSDGLTAYRCLKPWDIQGSLVYLGPDESGQKLLEFSGTVDTELSMNCARCLKEVRVPLHVPVVQRYVYGNETAGLSDEYDLDYLPTDGSKVDLEDVIRYSVSLAIPMRVLCKSDCLGLCPTCGKDLNLGPCSCPKTETDPRWDALKQFM